MKKLIILMLVAIATQATASEQIIRDGVFGSVLGAVIGNNIGDGDAKTGAVIGGVTAIIFGEQGRTEKRYHKSQQYHVRQHTVNHYHRHYCNCGVKTIRIEEKVWVPEKKVYDSCGKLIYFEPGHYVTHYKFRNVPVCKSTCR